MKVKTSNIPEASMINSYSPFHYRDAFECEIEPDKEISPDDIQITFWTRQPPWIEALFKLRNLLVKPFGLNTGESKGIDISELEKCIRTGGSYHMISVSGKSPNETILCLDDKHLRAYLSVYIEKSKDNRKKIKAITVVQFKYWLGYAYFYAIAPFHYIVVKSTLKNALCYLLEKNERE